MKQKALLDRQWLVEVDLEENPHRLREVAREYLAKRSSEKEKSDSD